MELFWTTMDYVGSDTSGLRSVWIYSGPIWIMLYVGSDNSGLGSVWICSGPIWIMLDQIILVLGSAWSYSGPIRSQARVSGAPWR